jgi:hypothetical protein
VEGGALVLNYTLDVTTAPSGAAFPGAGSPWANLSAVGTSHVRTPNPVPAATKGTEARPAAFLQIPAMTAEQLAAKATGLPTATQNRQHTVYMTRVNAGGDGASGPHPEREPA